MAFITIYVRIKQNSMRKNCGFMRKKIIIWLQN